MKHVRADPKFRTGIQKERYYCGEILQEVTCIQRVLIERLATGVGVRERVSTLLGEA